MNTYQLTTLVNPEVQEDSLNAVFGKIAEAVQKLGGIVEQQDMRKKIQLAYPIQKQREAYRGLLTFAMDPKEVEAFQKLVKGQKEILRFLLIVAPKIKVEIPTLAKASAKPVEEEKMSIEDIDKKLEEIFKEP
ncbi:MAG: 30S ribosomal protein S6 [Candidatus Wildermuthbacteria bacterium]|nr:30S ribosomal protein S6 [Candidatus Wildermuthbacteria bacterium]